MPERLSPTSHTSRSSRFLLMNKDSLEALTISFEMFRKAARLAIRRLSFCRTKSDEGGLRSGCPHGLGCHSSCLLSGMPSPAPSTTSTNFPHRRPRPAPDQEEPSRPRWSWHILQSPVKAGPIAPPGSRRAAQGAWVNGELHEPATRRTRRDGGQLWQYKILEFPY